MRKLLILIGALALTACEHTTGASGAPSFGQSIAAARTAQVNDTAPSTQAPEGDGASGALAQGRYHTDTTRALLPSSTSSNNPSTGSH